MTPSALSGLEGLRILVVEDVFILAKYMAEVLQVLGCDVVGPAANLKSAVELAARERLDGALVDLNLNGESAAPVFTALELRGVPALVMTGYGVDGVPRSLKHMRCLTKPVVQARLVVEMRAAFLLPAQARERS